MKIFVLLISIEVGRVQILVWFFKHVFIVI